MNVVDFALTQDMTGSNSLLWLVNSPVIDNSLQSLVIASLFTDRRITASDALPAFFDATQSYQGGFWGDDYPSDGSTPGIQARPHGSLLWTLRNAKQIEDTRSLTPLYIDDALQWLIDAGLATAVNTWADWRADGFLEAYVQITEPNGAVWNNQFLVAA